LPSACTGTVDFPTPGAGDRHQPQIQRQRAVKVIPAAITLATS
jgi:hypothetical protein